MNLIMQTVEFSNKGLADTGSREVREMMYFTLGKPCKGTWGNQGVSAGLMLAPYPHKMNSDVFVNCHYHCLMNVAMLYELCMYMYVWSLDVLISVTELISVDQCY